MRVELRQSNNGVFKSRQANWSPLSRYLRILLGVYLELDIWTDHHSRCLFWWNAAAQPVGRDGNSGRSGMTLLNT